jgi:hypothetical protein
MSRAKYRCGGGLTDYGGRMLRLDLVAVAWRRHFDFDKDLRWRTASEGRPYK